MTDEELAELIGDASGLILHRAGDAPSVHFTRSDLKEPARLRGAIRRQRIPTDAPTPTWDTDEEHARVVLAIARLCHCSRQDGDL